MEDLFHSFTVGFLLRPLITLNEISEKCPIVSHTPDVYIVSISCRWPSKDTKDRLFLYMICSSVIFAEEIVIL